MNRVKVWAYTVVVAGVGVAALRADLLSRRSEATAALDARLAAGAAQVSATTRAISREASAAAAFTARDAQLVQALNAKEAAQAKLLPRKRARGAPPALSDDEEAWEAALRAVARAALDGAEKTFGFDLPDGTVVTAGNREWLARKGEPSVAEGEAMAFLRGAIAGKAQRGWVRLNGAVFFAAAAPAGETAGLVVLVPLDEAWVKAAAAAAGAEVTLSAPDVKPLSTLRAEAAQPFTAWAAGPEVGTDVGRLAPAPASFGPVKLAKVPQPWGAPAAWRARAVPLEGVKNGYVVLAVSTAAPLGALAASHWAALAIVVALLLVGVAVGFLVRAAEAPATVPEALVQAASRIDRGDFAARAPRLAGRLGTIASALNKAAELAGPAAAGAASAPEPSVARALVLPPDPVPVPAPPPAAVPAAGLLQAAARAAAPGTVEVDEETHWQQIFQDFLRTRASCGETTEGLTYEKFRLKLEGNKAALASKYACKSVKFQVYVKDGKAALKATPVK
ncbi:MAG TPA: MXAN_5187 C-terminal domain-containing protein [Anaeromyxobacter sp.]|nr:MXAN_5187 C-terminal domain-containing protein [Anaeromyxobacter sp.]